MENTELTASGCAELADDTKLPSISPTCEALAESMTVEKPVSFARRYQERGMVPIPVVSKSKMPCRPKWPDSTLDTPLTDFKENANIGILLGDPSDGIVDVDLDCSEAIKAAPYLLPETVMVFGHKSKPDSHWIYRVAEPGDPQRFQLPDTGVLLEYRANKQFTIFPPSIHVSGEPIEFTLDGEPTAITRNDLLYAVNQLAACCLLAKYWRKGSRHDLALALSGGLLNAGWHVNKVQLFVKALCAAANDDELGDRLKSIETTMELLDRRENITGWPRLAEFLGNDVVDLATSWLGIEFRTEAAGLGHNGPPVDFDHWEICLTESGNADRFAKHYGNDARYCHELRHWIIWNGARWEQDRVDQIVRLADLTARSIFEEARDADAQDHRNQLADWAKRSCNKHVIHNVVELAESKLPISASSLDQNPWLLNCINGTLNLKTGILTKHRRDDWITKQIPVEYNSSAKCDLFLAFMDRIMAGDKELIAFIQRALGYSLTGNTNEQCWFIAHGEGANGKSTLLNLFLKLLGGYARNAPVHTFVQKRVDGGASEDLVRLQGARFVTITEAESNQKMADSLLKQITGGDVLTARELYKGSIEFEPQMKLWLATNHKPKIDGADSANWRRIRLIPFGVVVPESERDPQLPAKLWRESPGILAWAVRGALDWQADGLQAPEKVLRATSEYRDEMDDVRQFIADSIVTDVERTVTKVAMWEAYRRWADDNGGEKLDKKILTKRLKATGLKDGKSGGSRVWKGIKVLDSGWDIEDRSSEDIGTLRTSNSEKLSWGEEYPRVLKTDHLHRPIVPLETDW